MTTPRWDIHDDGNRADLIAAGLRLVVFRPHGRGRWLLVCPELSIDAQLLAEASLPLAEACAVAHRQALNLARAHVVALSEAPAFPAETPVCTPRPAIQPSGPPSRTRCARSGRGSRRKVATGPGAPQAGAGLGGASSLSSEDC